MFPLIYMVIILFISERVIYLCIFIIICDFAVVIKTDIDFNEYLFRICFVTNETYVDKKIFTVLQATLINAEILQDQN